MPNPTPIDEKADLDQIVFSQKTLVSGPNSFSEPGAGKLHLCGRFARGLGRDYHPGLSNNIKSCTGTNKVPLQHVYAHI